MFYLYIDEILISSYHNFSEVRDFIFDYYWDIVKRLDDFGRLSYSDLNAEFFPLFQKKMDHIIKELCKHNYGYFVFFGHEVQIHYGK